MRTRSVRCISFHLIMPLIISSCTVMGHYHSSGPQNITINTTLESVRASMAVYEVDAQCQAHHLGSIDLKEGPQPLAIPPDKLMRFVVTFKSFSLLQGSSSISAETWLTARRERHYEMDVKYANNIYGIATYEKDVGSVKRRALTGLPENNCH